MYANIYYDPEKYGLTLVGTVDYSDGSFQFDYTCVWVDEDRNLYYADDAGCSCPAPFEDMGRNDLTKTSLRGLRDHLRGRRAEAYRDYVTSQDVVDLVDKARKAMTG